MNFVPNSNNFIYPSQHQNVNTYNHGSYNQNAFQLSQGFGQFQQINNIPYQTVHFPPPNTLNSGRYVNALGQAFEKVLPQPAREKKPLPVFDPKDNKEVDLMECSKSKSLIKEIKSNTLAMKTSVSLNSFNTTTKSRNLLLEVHKKELLYQAECDAVVGNDNSVSDLSDQGSVDKYKMDVTINNGVEDKLEISDKENDITQKSLGKCKDSIKVEVQTDTLFDTTNRNESLSNKENFGISSSEIPSDTNSSINETGHNNTVDKSRLVYSRNTLLEISKHPKLPKPDIKCIEIVGDPNNKNYNLSLRLNFSQKSLTRTANGYLPPNLRIKEECSLNQTLDTIRKSFKSILNKIVPQNFNQCFLELQGLITSTDWEDVGVDDCMACLIEEIFDKAVQEEAYSVTYANLCKKIVKYDIEKEMNWDFKVSLISRCRGMFETPLQEQLESVRQLWERKTEQENDEQLKNLYRSEIDEKVKKAKDKYFGNIRFIAELYLHDLLQAKIINICAETLLSKHEEDVALLSLCKLLESCGKKFKETHNDKMKTFIERMIELSNSQTLNNRIKFRLNDIIDMSERNWTLRTIQAQQMIRPTTLDKVNKCDLEAKSIEASKKTNKSYARSKKNHAVNSFEMKFNVPQNSNQSIGFNSLRVTDNINFELKPSYGNWHTKKHPKDSDSEKAPSKQILSYNQLDENKPQLNLQPSSVTSRDDPPTISGCIGRFGLLLQNDDEDTETKSTLSADNEQEACNNLISSSSTREVSPVNVKLDEMDVVYSDEIFQNLLDGGYIDIGLWSQINNACKTVISLLDRMMEKDRSIRNLIGDELAKLISSDRLAVDDFTEGIRQFLMDVDDLKTDIPLIWQYLAEFLERFIINSEADINFFKVIFNGEGSRDDIGICVALCLKYADDRLGHQCMRRIINRCSWSIKDFVEGERLKEILEKNNANFILEEPTDQSFFGSIRNELIDLLPKDDEDVIQFLHANIDPHTLYTEECVYFVFSCIFSYISNLLSDDVSEFFCKKNSLILRLLDSRSYFERQTLKALNDSADLLNERGLLTVVVHGLVDHIFSPDTFRQLVDWNVSEGDCVNEDIHIETIRSMLLSRKH